MKRKEAFFHNFPLLNKSNPIMKNNFNTLIIERNAFYVVCFVIKKNKGSTITSVS